MDMGRKQAFTNSPKLPQMRVDDKRKWSMLCNLTKFQSLNDQYEVEPYLSDRVVANQLMIS